MLTQLARKEVLALMGVTVFLLVFTIFNGVSNVLIQTVVSILQTDNVLEPAPLDITWRTFFGFHMTSLAFYGALALAALVFSCVAVYKLRSNFRSLEAGQKGTSRFTTLNELKTQYRAVPEKKRAFAGSGGVPISRHKNQLFIDDSPVNNLWIGTTRSGKGEIGMFSLLDVYSRAEEKASLVVNDPKGELFAASKETLEKRGYHVEVLNLMKPMESMSYQILQLVIDAYKQADYATAQQLTQCISFMLYLDPHTKDKFWQESAISLCNALILAVCDKCIQEGKEEQITMYSVANMLTTLATEKVTDPETGAETDALDRYFNQLPHHHVARMQYATLNFSSGVTRAGILANASSKLGIFTLDSVAKMTSKSSFDLKRVGFGRSLVGSAPPLTRVRVTFPDATSESVKSDANGRFELNFAQDLQAGDTLQMTGAEQQATVRLTAIDEGTGKAQIEAGEQNSAIRIHQLDYFTKPTAIFMLTPDYDESLHIIASLFVKQLYTELARHASLAKGSQTLREVVFILDEFGNMPAIDGMSGIITVCLGRNIRFNLVIQSYSQLKEKYGDAWETIDGNCGNTIYVLTTDTATAEKIASKLGERTITTKSRSGTTLSFDKSKTESVDGRKLLTPNELMQLEEGETVVIRIIKRQDLKKKRIKPYPIFNTGESAMKYRWEYLADEFDTSRSINDIDIPCRHADVELKTLVIDFKPPDGIEPAPAPVMTETTDRAGDWRELDVATFFRGDSALAIIEASILGGIALEQEEVFAMNIVDFLDLLENMVSREALKPNVRSALTAKATRLAHQFEGGNPA